jgi:hypothetical protein
MPAMPVFYGSFRSAHNALLNTFCDHVIRGGATWQSIEMVGIVTQTGVIGITKTRGSA